jgi:hypothetical protein
MEKRPLSGGAVIGTPVALAGPVGTIGQGALVVLVVVPDLDRLVVLSEVLEDLEHDRHKKFFSEAALLGGLV